MLVALLHERSRDEAEALLGRKLFEELRQPMTLLACVQVQTESDRALFTMVTLGGTTVGVIQWQK